MEEKKKKGLLVIVFSVIVVIITGTFAWLNWRSQNTAMVLRIGEVNGLQVTLTPYQINGTLSPVSTYSDGIVINVTANNRKSVEDNFKLYYQIDTIDNALIDSGFKYTITKCTANCDTASNYTVLTNDSGDFSNASSNSTLNIYQENIPANTTYKYKVYLWIDSSSGNQSNMQNKTFIGELRATISDTLYNMMRDNAVIDNARSTYVTSNTGINWNNISSDTNGKGIYLRAGTENDTYPVYYYRGAVTDNNVIFGGFCWKIVRTTSTGGTKLIYNGVPSNGECNNTGTDTQLATTSKFNNNNDSLAYVGYMYGTAYTAQNQTMTSINETYMYATGYDETNHRLVSTDAMNFAGTDWGTYYNQLSNNHYTCFNTSGECDQVYYIYYTNSFRAYYIQIPTGKTISGMIDEMLTSSSNTTDSAIKTVIDTWYAANMISYTSYLEDTPYCNDRHMTARGGLVPTNNTTELIQFGFYWRAENLEEPILTCDINDSFTVSANLGNGKLTYTVGLLTGDEIWLAGSKRGNTNSTNYVNTLQRWLTMTPSTAQGIPAVQYLQEQGMFNGSGVSNSSAGVRPVVSLKHGTVFTDGDGTANNPYVVSEKWIYTANTGTSVEIGSAIPNGVTEYKTPNEAMNALKVAGGANTDYPFFLRHVKTNNNVTDSYVGFVITSDMVTENPDMKAGTYYLKGGDSGSAYTTNKAVLDYAFGSANCTDYTTEYYCGVYGLASTIGNDGYVDIGDTQGTYCSVDENGYSSCVANEFGL